MRINADIAEASDLDEETRRQVEEYLSTYAQLRTSADDELSHKTASEKLEATADTIDQVKEIASGVKELLPALGTTLAALSPQVGVAVAAAPVGAGALRLIKKALDWKDA